ncbi:peptidyl-tRNA hydrolase [Endogone sp. FLAS-F59071]|nr:peptidyl-tRNA hydrolase [Endogone sp. FLAS-F59071]|eukprot:RUS14621.1 peptidyl-tRNA hydrolase [Endogone sp. FLAS-F59071]
MSRPVDFVIVGLGNVDPTYAGTRHNAGYIFINYLANAMSMSSGADIRDTVFQTTFVAASSPESSTSTVMNSLRVVLVKPLTAMNECGQSVRKVLQHYAVTDFKKQLLVVCDDLNTLPGALTLQSKSRQGNVFGGTLRSLAGHKGVESICSVLETTEFVRFRLGIGRPTENISIPDYVLSSIAKENKEMDLFGYVLEQTTAALSEFAQTGDLQKVKKKYASSKKIPKKMTEMVSLEFPVDVHGV